MTKHPKANFTGRAIVGIDLDGVCANYTAGFRPYAAAHLGVDPATLREPEVYNLVRAGWGFSDGADYMAAQRRAVEEGLYRNLPMIPGASEALRTLSDAGAHIRIVSHRLIMGGAHARVVADTAAWLDLHRIPYMSLCFTGLKDSVGAHVYVEDAPKNVEVLRAHQWETFVFDQTYNQEVPGPRITNWQEGAEQLIAYLRDQGQL